MQKKQGIIQARLTNKPSFKNIINIQHEKVVSRSKSKSQKSKSQSKISYVSSKSPKRPIPRPKQNNNNTMPYTSEPGSEFERGEYSQVTSEINRNQQSKTPKKNKNFQESMKKIILLKNKSVQIEQTLTQQQEILCKKNEQSKSHSHKSLSINKDDSHRLRNMSNYLDLHLKQIEQQCKAVQQKYRKCLGQLIESQDQQRMRIVSFQVVNKKQKQLPPNMVTLEGKIEMLQKLLI